MVKDSYSIIIYSMVATLFVVISIKVAFFLTLHNLYMYASLVKSFIAARPIMAVGIYIIFYSFITAFALPGAAVLAVAGGFFFGLWPGTLYALIAVTSGSALCFLGVRYLYGLKLQQKYKAYSFLFGKELELNGVYYLLFCRLLPFIPSFLVTIVAGLAPLSLHRFLGATLIGVAPALWMRTLMGSQLCWCSRDTASLSWPLWIIFSALAFLVLIPALVTFKKR